MLFGRPAVTVAVILCGGVAMQSLWSSRAGTFQRADGRASSVLPRSPSMSVPKLQVDLDGGRRLPDSPGPLNRDPFRFYVRHATLTSQITVVPPPATTFEPAWPAAPAVPPMPWKLMGIVQRSTTRWAVFSDCRSVPVPKAEGEWLEGQWRVTTIGLESVSLQSRDDREMALPLRGCRPR